MLKKLLQIFSSKKYHRKSHSGRFKRNFFDNENSSSRSFKRKKTNIIPLFTQKTQLLQKCKKYGAVVWICSITACILFLFFGPLLRIQEILISSDDDQIININQSYSSVDSIRNKNLLFINTNDLAKRIQKQQNTIRNISIQAEFPSILHIKLSAYTVLFQTEKYLILENGAVKEKWEENYDLIPTLQLSEDITEKAAFGNMLDAWDLWQISLLKEYLERNIPGFSIAEMQYFISEKELLLSTDTNTIFIFDLDEDVTNQGENLAIYHKEWGNILKKKYIYIDVRNPKRLDGCWFESEFLCRLNLKNIYSDTIFQDLELKSSQSEQ